MAAFTQKELEISNRSYTNKDFEAIYLELLETAEKISKRFSPTNANEADPFIVLLKLVAAVSDKVNYNVDKNILERFLLSCTQEKSMRELTDMLGYSMKYYQSAETSVIFKYDFTDADEGLQNVEIPAFSILTDGDSIQYITVENTKISRDEGASTEVAVIQGKLKELDILGNTNIQLDNLNANNRLYLPEVMIAENGISITNAASATAWQAWKAADNLNTETYGSLVYKFGFDSVKNLPFLDFPDWISDIIGKGLNIKYIITDGSAGNISARSLKTVTRLNPPSDNVNDADITVINLSAATSGAEPETMSDAYKGFKKLIGTFDTLVTCRDYANKIYNLMTTYNTPFVSNIQVGDRRTDINYGCDVVSASTLGAQVRSSISYHYDELLSSEEAMARIPKLTEDDLGKIFYVYDFNMYFTCKKDISDNLTVIELSESDLIPEILPYDLCLYGLRPISNTSYLAVDDANGYNKAYNMLTNPSDLKSIQMQLEDVKTMSHVYKDLKDTDIGYIQNLYKLDATVNTSRKVNVLEQSEIIININNALISKYNPRHLQFGQEIAFDELLTTIEQADSRIKSVSLQEPEQTPKIILRNSAAIDLYDANGKASDQFKFILSKNILSGRIEAFEYDTDFNYTFYQKEARKYTQLVKASTSCNIDAFAPGSNTYILNDNEAIQFLAPNLRTEVTYPYGINYYLKFASSDMTHIPKDTEYRLQPGDELVFTYMNNNDETVIVPYIGISGDSDVHIIKPNFDFYSSEYRNQNNETPTKIGVQNNNYSYMSDIHKFYTLSSNQSVEYRTLVYDKLRSFKKCYWLTNQPNNEIRWREIPDQPLYREYVLADGEYFFYTDASLTSLYAFGAGTRLKLSVATTMQSTVLRPSEWQHNNYINIDDITLNGLASLGDYFIGKSFDNEYVHMDIYENELITLTSDDTLEITNNGESAFSIPDNDFALIPDSLTIRYKFDGTDEEYNSLPDRSTLTVADAGWQVRSVLDINVGPNKPQALVGNQQITFTPGFYDAISKRYVAYDDIVSEDQQKESGVTLGKIHLTGADKHRFEATTSIITSGGPNINLQYMDLDLTYKCPSILQFKDAPDPILQDLTTGFYVPSFSTDPSITTAGGKVTATAQCALQVSPVDCLHIDTEVTIDTDGEDELTNSNFYNYLNNKVYYDNKKNSYYTCVRVSNVDMSQVVVEDHDPVDIANHHHTYQWKKIDNIYPSSRLFMLYVEGINDTTSLVLESNSAASIRLYNKVDNINTEPTLVKSLSLNNGLNIVEVTDIINGQTVMLCDTLTLTVTATGKDESEALEHLNAVPCLISQFKVNKGLNPLLGITEADEIFKYIKTHFHKQFREFFVCAELDPARHIEASEDYKLNSAQAFYDSNNIANKWVMCKIDFPSSNIKIARGSKK